jgi:hypothetical protein
MFVRSFICMDKFMMIWIGVPVGIVIRMDNVFMKNER